MPVIIHPRDVILGHVSADNTHHDKRERMGSEEERMGANGVRAQLAVKHLSTTNQGANGANGVRAQLAVKHLSN